MFPLSSAVNVTLRGHGQSEALESEHSVPIRATYTYRAAVLLFLCWEMCLSPFVNLRLPTPDAMLFTSGSVLINFSLYYPGSS